MIDFLYQPQVPHITSQDASRDVYAFLGQSDEPSDANIPTFRASTNQIDLLRLFMLALGIVIGVKVLR